MPRPAKPARLYLRKDDNTWIVRDRNKDYRTGCPGDNRAGAERWLADYIARKAATAPGESGHASAIQIAEVLRVYALERGPHVANKAIFADTISTLVPFWAERMVSEIKGGTCREYAASRGNRPTARRELETLRAAVNHYHREYGLESVPSFTMPQKPLARDRWLNRAEAARLLKAARASSPHLARYILIAIYTGTRTSATLSLGWMPSTTGGHVDLNAGLLYRAPIGHRQTKKRQPTARIPDRLLAHLRRWKDMDDHPVRIVHWNGRQVASIKKAFRTARKAAGLDGAVIPHCLRHTSVTWAMQNGMDKWQACGFFGLTMETLESVYGHHHPDFQDDVKRAFRTDTARKQSSPSDMNVNKSRAKKGTKSA